MKALYLFIYLFLVACSSGDGKHPRTLEEQFDNTNAVLAEAEEILLERDVVCSGDCNAKISIALIKNSDGFDSCLSYSLGNNKFLLSSSCANEKLRSTLSDCTNNLLIVGQDKKVRSCSQILHYEFADTNTKYPQIFNQDYLIVEVEGVVEKEADYSNEFSLDIGDGASLDIISLDVTDSEYQITSKRCQSLMGNFINPTSTSSNVTVLNVSECNEELSKGDLIFEGDDLVGYITKESECSGGTPAIDRPSWCNSVGFNGDIPFHYYAFNLSCLKTDDPMVQGTRDCRQDINSSELVQLRTDKIESALSDSYLGIKDVIDNNPFLSLCVAYSKGILFTPISDTEECSRELPELGNLLPSRSLLKWPIRYRVRCIKNNSEWIASQCEKGCGTDKEKFAKKAQFSIDLPWGTSELILDQKINFKSGVHYKKETIHFETNVNDLTKDGESNLKLLDYDKDFQNIPLCPTF